jgi:hypothetical protein
VLQTRTATSALIPRSSAAERMKSSISVTSRPPRHTAARRIDESQVRLQSVDPSFERTEMREPALRRDDETAEQLALVHRLHRRELVGRQPPPRLAQVGLPHLLRLPRGLVHQTFRM